MTARRIRKRWPLLLAIVLILLAVAGAVVFLLGWGPAPIRDWLILVGGKLRRSLNALAGFIAAIVVFGGAWMWMVDKVRDSQAERRRVTEALRGYFDLVVPAPASPAPGPDPRFPVSPREIVANGWAGSRSLAGRFRATVLKQLEGPAKPGAALVFLDGGPRSGKSVFLRQMAEELAADPGGHRLEVRWLREDRALSTRRDWEERSQVVHEYVRLAGGKKLVLFLDDLHDSLEPEARALLGIYDQGSFSARVRADFGGVRPGRLQRFWHKQARTLVVTTAPPLLRDIQTPGWQEKEPAADQEPPPPVLRLELGRLDMSQMLEKYAARSGWPGESVEGFLGKPGAPAKCRGDVSFLHYLFLQYVEDPDGNQRYLRHALPDETKRRLEECDGSAPEFKNALLVLALSQAMNLAVPESLLKGHYPQWVLDRLHEGYTRRDVRGRSYLADPFLGYVLLARDHADDATGEGLSGLLQPFVDYAVGFVNPRTVLARLAELRFLRGLLHGILEEQYRPILNVPGRPVARSLARSHLEPLSAVLLQELVPKLEAQPHLVWDVRRWASTLFQLGAAIDLPDLYGLVLKTLSSGNVDPGVRTVTLYQLAGNLADSPIPGHRAAALAVYRDLLTYAKAKPSVRLLGRLLARMGRLILLERKPAALVELLDNSGVNWTEDSLLCELRGEALAQMGTGTESLVAAEACFRAALEVATKTAALRPSHNYLYPLHRYTMFLVDNYHLLPPDEKREDLGKLVAKVVALAEEEKQDIQAAYNLRAQYREKIAHDLPAALEDYRAAVRWCESRGDPNSRPRLVLANFLVEQSSNLPGEPALYLREAEDVLVKTASGAQLPAGLRRSLHSVLGRLVGCLPAGAQPYTSSGGRERPDYQQALEYMEESFESDRETRFDPSHKTFQDVYAHASVKDILVRQALRERNIEVRRSLLREADRHFRPTFEGLPRADLDTRQIRMNTVSATDAYAMFLWKTLGREGCLGYAEAIQEAERCYESALARAREWGYPALVDQIKRHIAVFERHTGGAATVGAGGEQLPPGEADTRLREEIGGLSGAIEAALRHGRDPNAILQQAETRLRYTLDQTRDAAARRIGFNTLGRLVGGALHVARTYRSVEGRARPDFDEGLALVDQSFESDPKTRFDPSTITRQDLRAHLATKDILVQKAFDTSDPEEKARLLQTAAKHFRAAFEDLPRPGSDDEQLREHVAREAANYAFFVLDILVDHGRVGLESGISEATSRFAKARAKAGEWGLSRVSRDLQRRSVSFEQKVARRAAGSASGGRAET